GAPAPHGGLTAGPTAPGPAGLLGRHPGSVPGSLHPVARVPARRRGKPAEAEAVLRRALDLREELAGSGVPQRRHELAQTLHELGRLLSELGRLTKAEAVGRKALAIREQLTADAPSLR